MSYFKKTIKIIIIVLYLEFTYSQTILDSIRNIGLNLDNLVFCNEFWLPTNKFSGLKEKLKSDVFGQPFVKNNLIPILEDYYIKPNYKDGRNALVLSFHGPSGVGKSFVSEILSFAPFIKNKHLFSAKNIFFDRSLIDKHKANINQLIDSSVRDCEKSLFVFDDADYFPSGFFEKLNVFRNIDGDLKYGGSMFIFIFQVGAEQLSTLTLDLLNKGEKREAFHVQDFRDIIKDAMLDKGYSKDSIFMKPLNKIIPFLPLEKEHVKKCIDKGLVSDGYDITENDYKVPSLCHSDSDSIPNEGEMLNDRVEILINFAHRNNLHILNTYNNSKGAYKWIWSSPNDSKHEIDYILAYKNK